MRAADLVRLADVPNAGRNGWGRGVRRQEMGNGAAPGEDESLEGTWAVPTR